MTAIMRHTGFPADPIELPEWELPNGVAIPTVRLKKTIPNAHWLVSYQNDQNLQCQGREYIDALIKLGVIN